MAEKSQQSSPEQKSPNPNSTDNFKKLYLDTVDMVVKQNPKSSADYDEILQLIGSQMEFLESVENKL